MNIRNFSSVRFALALLLVATLALSCATHEQPATESAAPNILWINIDDQSPWYGSYGDDKVQTPNIDSLANNGVVFERAYASSPVCAPSRSAIITGSYSIRTGTHDMRSGRVPGYQINLPEEITTLPELLRQADYETYNAGKDDFNFNYNKSDLYSIYDKAVVDKDKQNYKGEQGSGDWRDAAAGKPFFGQTQVAGGKSVDKNLAADIQALGYQPLTAKDVEVPGQYPDIPEVRQQIADHYNSIMQTDYQVGQLIDRLKSDGHWQDTVIFLFSDHGSDLPRSKEFLYQEGLRVPLIVIAPGMQNIVRSGTRRKDIVNLMDVAATSLALAGLEIPDFMDSKNLFADDYAREYVFSSSDRMSNVIDRVRSVIGDRYHYIRNFHTDRPLYNWGHREMMALEYPGTRYDYFLTLRELAKNGKLTTAQAAPYGPRVAEELYDLHNDPDQIVNLADDLKYQAVLDEMRQQLAAWIKATDDKGQYPRSDAAMKEITDRFPESWLRSPEFRQ